MNTVASLIITCLLCLSAPVVAAGQLDTLPNHAVKKDTVMIVVSKESAIPDSLVQSAPVATQALFTVDSAPLIDSTRQGVGVPDNVKNFAEDTKQNIKRVGSIVSIGEVVAALLLFLVGWLFIKYLSLLLHVLSERWPKYRFILKGLIPVFKVTSWVILLFIVIMGVFHPPIESVFAFGASAGIAVGFASQDVLKNVFGGLMVLFDKPFRVGDKIKVDVHYGEVLSIGLRTVRIVTADDTIISIPNSEVVNTYVANSNSGSPDCQVVAEFYFPLHFDMDRGATLARKCACVSRYVYLEKPVSVIFLNEQKHNESVVKMRLKAYVFDHRYEAAFQSDMTKSVFREFRSAGLI
jgi:MscS family membrane protein